MIVAFDASLLIYLFDEHAPPPIDKISGQHVDQCQVRLKYLIASLSRAKAKIVIPTPSLAEALVKAQEGAPERLRILKSSKHFRIAPFDERAAVEYAAVQAARHAAGTRPPASTRAKAKFDDQIVAIATVERANTIYSDDDDIAKLAGEKFTVIGIGGLPLPPADQQADIFSYRPPSDESEKGEKK